MSDSTDRYIEEGLKTVLAELIGKLIIDLEVEAIRRRKAEDILRLIAEAQKQDHE